MTEHGTAQQANPHEAGYVKEVTWRAKCLCGWEGPARSDSLAAHFDYDQHRRDENEAKYRP